MMTIIRSVIELAIIGYLIYLSIYDMSSHCSPDSVNQSIKDKKY